jgi:hypothetical protein
MGARLINNPRQTNRDYVGAFPALHMRSLRKAALFKEGHQTVGFFQHPSVSKVIPISVDLRVEHDLKLIAGHGDSATIIQIIRLTHRPAGFNGRRWYFVNETGERAESLFLVDGRFRTRREARLTYRSQSMGELDRVLERRRKLEAQLKGTSARGPARGRRRKQAEERLEEIEDSVNGFGWALLRRIENSSVLARERKQRSLDRLEAARTAMTQRKDVDAEWVIKTFGSSVDGLKAGTILPDPSPKPPRSVSSDPASQVDIGMLQRLGFVKPGRMLGDQLGWPEAWLPEPGRRIFFLVDLRDRQRPCAVFVICNRERQAHQLFALKPIKGRFGRQEYRFICPHTGHLSNVVSYSEGAFSVRRYPSDRTEKLDDHPKSAATAHQSGA